MGRTCSVFLVDEEGKEQRGVIFAAKNRCTIQNMPTADNSQSERTRMIRCRALAAFRGANPYVAEQGPRGGVVDASTVVARHVGQITQIIQPPEAAPVTVAGCGCSG